MRFLLAISLTLSFCLIASCGGGGGSGAPAIPSTQYAALGYEIESDGSGTPVFTSDASSDNDVVVVAVMEPVYVPDVNGTWSGRVLANYIPMGEFGTFTPDNPATVTVTVTRLGGNVTLVVRYASDELFRIDDAALTVGGSATGTTSQDGDTHRYVLEPWATTAAADLAHNWNAVGFTEAGANLNISAGANNAISATIGGRTYTGKTILNYGYLLGTGAPDSIVVLEDLGGNAARGYFSEEQAAGPPHTFDTFTLNR